jgi:hypothetical protein
MSGCYMIQLGPVVFDCWRDGRPFTLADCWRELDGVGAARILDCRGRVVLDRAGEHLGRRARVRAMYRARQYRNGGQA